ncbi:hypothetical protein Skr01_58210 [Sphaerisporangium krabiense]|uniref:Cupin n=1 Tax=Sphaerisporangium krabiense TaxID=763782 RepID=A0A7W8Z9A3_9ACTN|nr:hypothetical protein [Sphaerisporangium krabiense]MBB5629413.1 hypothetical protein [Sphaerisporangium krabiense]GII65736.1 hypothetical protein Skr01_58210 [Sphaerisporangium krabiense]
MKYQELHDELTSGAVSPSVPRRVLGLLEDIAAGRSAIRAVRHPLGFVCLPVARGGACGVCLHLWSADLPRAGNTTSEVHCHSWDLVSYVLYGQVRNELVGVTDSATGATHQLMRVVSAGGVDNLSPTGRTVTFREGAAGVYRAGDVYTMPAGVFHRSVIPDGVDTATIALGSGRPGAADLSLGPLGTRSHRVTRERCDDEETARAARLAADHLART